MDPNSDGKMDASLKSQIGRAKWYTIKVKMGSKPNIQNINGP